MMERKTTGLLFKFCFYSTGLQIFIGRECSSRARKMSSTPLYGFKRSQESFLVNCKFDGLPWVSVFSRYVQLTLLQAGDTLCY